VTTDGVAMVFNSQRTLMQIGLLPTLRCFADDTKLWINLESEADSAILQTDFDSLSKWS